MTILKAMWDETLGLFVDDGALAIQIVILIVALTTVVKLFGLPPLLAAALLVVGLLGILAVSLRRKVRGSWAFAFGG